MESLEMKGQAMSTVTEFLPTVAPGVRTGKTFFASMLKGIGCCGFPPAIAGARRMGAYQDDYVPTLEDVHGQTGNDVVDIDPGQASQWELEKPDLDYSYDTAETKRAKSKQNTIVIAVAVTAAVIAGGFVLYRIFRH